MKYTTKLIRKEEIAQGTMAFHFEKPDGFTFKAGQFLDWTLLNPKENDGEGAMRAFSIVSAPSEADISFATRMRDTAFKRNLQGGEDIQMSIDGPIGSFVLHQNAARPAVFLIGGIGITPVYSIIKEALANNLPHNLYLFYSNRTEKDSAFLKELAHLSEQHKNFIFVPTLTEEEGDEWKGEKGFINHDMVKKYIPDLSTAICYIAGPQKMVTAMRTLLEELAVSEDEIRTEEFSGY
jgi:ferredoxin-NADP reductase